MNLGAYGYLQYKSKLCLTVSLTSSFNNDNFIVTLNLSSKSVLIPPNISILISSVIYTKQC